MADISVSQSIRPESFSDQQMRDLRQIFDWLDVDGNGDIDASELLIALRSASPNATIEQAERLVRDITKGERGTIGWLEFGASL